MMGQRLKIPCAEQSAVAERLDEIEKGLGSWGIQVPWGDYELIFGGSKLHLEIVEMPVHYQERTYGVTKMTRVFWNGVRMLRICHSAWRMLHG